MKVKAGIEWSFKQIRYYIDRPLIICLQTYPICMHCQIGYLPPSRRTGLQPLCSNMFLNSHRER